jgi:hypothetical protein
MDRVSTVGPHALGTSSTEPPGNMGGAYMPLQAVLCGLRAASAPLGTLWPATHFFEPTVSPR